MDSRAARKDTAQHVGGDDAITTRLGTVALPSGSSCSWFRRSFIPVGKIPWTTWQSSGSTLIAMSGPPFTSASTSAFYSCLAAWSPSTILSAAGRGRSGTCAIRPRRGSNGGGLLHGSASSGWHSPQASSRCLDRNPGRPGECRVRSCRGDQVGRDRHEQPLILPYGAYPLPLRDGHRTRERLRTLGKRGGVNNHPGEHAA